MMKGDAVKVKFDPGQIVITPTAMNALADAGQTPGEFLRRHVCGDWGQLDRGDVKANESALKTGLRLLSSYPLKSGEVLWIITEAVDIEFGGKPTHRELTTLLLPADY